jgi:hypothetical protein
MKEMDDNIEKKLIKNNINYPAGSKIIIKGNNDSPYRVAVIVRWDFMQHATKQSIHPVIKFEDSDEEFYSFGIIRHYIRSRNKALDKLSGRDQWNVLSEFHQMKDIG